LGGPPARFVRPGGRKIAGSLWHSPSDRPRPGFNTGPEASGIHIGLWGTVVPHDSPSGQATSRPALRKTEKRNSPFFFRKGGRPIGPAQNWLAGYGNSLRECLADFKLIEVWAPPSTEFSPEGPLPARAMKKKGPAPLLRMMFHDAPPPRRGPIFARSKVRGPSLWKLLDGHRCLGENIPPCPAETTTAFAR